MTDAKHIFLTPKETVDAHIPFFSPKLPTCYLIKAHQTFPRINPRYRIRSLGSGMIAQILLLILTKLGIRPIGSLNIFHPLKECGPRDVHFVHDCILFLFVYCFVFD